MPRRSGLALGRLAAAADGVESGLVRSLVRHPAVRDTLVGAVVASIIALALAPLRDSVGSANAALALAIVVMIVGVRAGLKAGLVIAVWAASLYTFLHAVPHGLPRIEEEQDALTAALLLVAGAAAGIVRRRLDRLQHRLTDETYGVARIHSLAETVVNGAPMAEVIRVACELLRDELRLEGCRWEEGRSTSALPSLSSSGRVDGLAADAGPDALAEVMAGGVALDLAPHGRLTMVGDGSHAPTAGSLRVAAIMRDLVLAGFEAREASEIVARGT